MHAQSVRYAGESVSSFPGTRPWEEHLPSEELARLTEQLARRRELEQQPGHCRTVPERSS